MAHSPDDRVSPSCDVGAHERCAGCSCGCHARQRLGAGPLLVWSPRHDYRTLIQVLSAAIPGAIALGLMTWCIVLAAGGLL